MRVSDRAKTVEGLRNPASRIVALDAGPHCRKRTNARAPWRSIEQEIVMHRMRDSVHVHLAPVKAKFGIAVAVRVTQFSANVFVHIFGEHRAHRESRPESGIR
jgi:hypothetical protein